jgi:Transposase DDE domain
MQTSQLWSLWQDQLEPFHHAFTDHGFPRFVQWVTGLVLNVEEHTITQSLIGLDQADDWKALENFAEIGHWNQPVVERTLALQLEDAPGRLWHGYRVSAVDDSKVHRDSAKVWGTCTYHEYTARCPNRAKTVRAHNWVVLGALLYNQEQPAWFLPQTGKLYFRQSQLPSYPDPEEFFTKNELVVQLLQEQAVTIPGKHLGVMDGAFATASVVRPLVCPEPGLPRIDFVTRLRKDARLHALPPPEPPAGDSRRGRGAWPKWGKRLPPPRRGGQWPGGWQEGVAYVYGRRRKVRWKEVLCQWHVLGHDVVVKAVVAEVEGYRKRFYLVSSAVELTGLQIVVLFGARWRQEDGFRDLKQRLGWEECRAWTKKPVLRTSWAQMVALSLLRLLQFKLEGLGETAWWLRPPWNQRKTRPSVLDVERLLRSRRQEIQQLLREWLKCRENKTEPESMKK